MLRYYPPEKQGLRHNSLVFFINQRILRYYPPEKQGLRQIELFHGVLFIVLRYYPPEKQGLRLPQISPQAKYKFPSDTILQKNKD